MKQVRPEFSWTHARVYLLFWTIGVDMKYFNNLRDREFETFRSVFENTLYDQISETCYEKR